MSAGYAIVNVGRNASLVILTLGWLLLLLVQLRRRAGAGHLLLVLGAACLAVNALTGLAQSILMPVIMRSQGAEGVSRLFLIAAIITAVFSLLGWLLMVIGLAVKVLKDDRTAVAAA